MRDVTTFQRARSEEQREIRRRTILNTAAAMLAEMPVSEVSLNELSRRVGLAKSNVLRYFESREAILLELLDSAWKQWLAELPNELEAGIEPDSPVRERSEQLAALLTQSLARQRTFCDLLSAQAAVLEHNVSPEVAARYKKAAMADIDAMAALVLQQLPELGDHAKQLCIAALIATGAVWTHAHPSKSMLAAYEADPSLAAQRLDFTDTLQENLANLIAGTLARSAP